MVDEGDRDVDSRDEPVDEEPEAVEPPAPPRAGGRVGRILEAVEKVEGAAGVLVLLGIVVLVMVQVLVRFTSLGGWAWTGELARFGLVWLTFVMAGHLMGRDEHITIDMIDYVLSDRGRRVVRTAASLVVGVICVAYAYEGVGLMDMQRGITSSAAEIPMPVIYAVPTLGFALTAVRALAGPFVWRESR